MLILSQKSCFLRHNRTDINTHIPTVIKKSKDKNKTTSFCDLRKIEIIISKSEIGVTATTSKFTVNYI